MLRMSIIAALLAASCGQALAEFGDENGYPIIPLTLENQRKVSLALERRYYRLPTPVSFAGQNGAREYWNPHFYRDLPDNGDSSVDESSVLPSE